jgi:hypothetical protein
LPLSACTSSSVAWPPKSQAIVCFNGKSWTHNTNNKKIDMIFFTTKVFTNIGLIPVSS